MSIYSATAAPRALYPGQSLTLFDADAVVAGDSSPAFTLPVMPGGGRAELAISTSFAASPTTAVVKLQIANANADAKFVDTSTASTNTQTDELQASITAPFARLDVTSYSAGGALTASVYRIA